MAEHSKQEANTGMRRESASLGKGSISTQ